MMFKIIYICLSTQSNTVFLYITPKFDRSCSFHLYLHLVTRTISCLLFIGPSGLRATSGLAEQLRETTIFGIFPLVAVVAVSVTLLAFTPDVIVVGF